jgi:hypothetical protein
MQNNRLGCLTGTGIIAAILTISAIFGFALFSGNQMFSAGALNAQTGETLGGVSSHAQIAGCSDCHTSPLASDHMADRCVVCHTDIAAQMFDVAKLHGMITQKNSTLACRDCHPEHRGPSASLTELGENSFPHDALGFSLAAHQKTASNQPFSCDDCHQGDITTFAVDSCDSCHRQMDAVFAQAHSISYGTACLDCHDGVDRFGNSFSHASFTFKTGGGHADVACVKCHTDARSLADFQNTPQDCYSCHNADDEHNGQFGTDCGQCHSATSWKDATFDHNLSAFKLEGEHGEVACEKCHVSNVFKGTPTDCYSCHKNKDEHNGEFGTDCAACHNPSNWDDASFDHNRSNFPLTGAHTGVECEQCHTNGQFKGLASTCVSCHAEPVEHAGQFGTDCVACHSTTAWTPAEFNGEHTFPLNHGESGRVSCATCHPSNYTTYTCYGCHEHNESNVASEHREEGISDFQDCMECHPDGREHD